MPATCSALIPAARTTPRRRWISGRIGAAPSAEKRAAMAPMGVRALEAA